jgi:hypothetical protein
MLNKSLVMSHEAIFRDLYKSKKERKKTRANLFQPVRSYPVILQGVLSQGHKERNYLPNMNFESKEEIIEYLFSSNAL